MHLCLLDANKSRKIFAYQTITISQELCIRHKRWLLGTNVHLAASNKPPSCELLRADKQ